MLVEDTQVQPLSSGTVARSDGCFVFSLCGRKVAFFLGQARFHPMRHGRVKRKQAIRLRLGFIASAANDAGGFKIEFGEIGAGVHIFWVQPNRRFKLRTHVLGKAGSCHPAGTVRFLAVHSAEPKMVLAIIRRQRYRLFASGDAAVPIAHSEISAAQKIMREGIVRTLSDVSAKNADSLVDAASGEERRSTLISSGERGGHKKKYRYETK